MNKEIKYILEEMCRRINIPFNSIDFKSQGWFKKHSWTRKEEDDYVDWLYNQFWDNKELRILFMRDTRKIKNNIRSVVNEFVLTYGWRLKE